MSDATREWIQSASYEQLLSKLRFGETGDPCFDDAHWDLFQSEMRRKRVSPEHHTATSKKIGW